MLREIEFDPPIRPKIVEAIYSTVRTFWTKGYDRLVDLTSVLMVVAWITALVTLLTKFLSSETVRAVADVCTGAGWLPSVVASSALLFYNGLVTAAFAEPDYRYHHMVLPIRIVIAAMGVVAVVRLFSVLVGAKEIERLYRRPASFNPDCRVGPSVPFHYWIVRLLEHLYVH